MTGDDFRELHRLLGDSPRVESLMLAVSTLLDVIEADKAKWDRLQALSTRSEFLAICVVGLLDAAEISQKEVLSRYNKVCHLGEN